MNPVKKQILIVEDEKSLRDALVDILRIKNFQPIEAKNGKEGVTVALRIHPDLIILDLIMPEMDGTMALTEIRNDTWGQKVPIIILTNLTAAKDNTSDKTILNDNTLYLIKSDWKLHDIVKKIMELLK